MIVQNSGVLALIQDQGRIGQHRIGLTVGGPMDPFAFIWGNRLCYNQDNASGIEVSVGGFSAEFEEDTQIAVTGAVVDVTLNGSVIPMWQTINIKAGDRLKMGYASIGCRIYLSVAGGFQVTPQFGSTATVVRESIGGTSGAALVKGERLSLLPNEQEDCLKLAERWWPDYGDDTPLNVVLGYQQDSFSTINKALFFSSEYTVSERMSRMGYRLTGPKCESSIRSMLSEGISHGAIQIPPDGQPIVLLNDRQTIGGYPKLGSVMSVDAARLAQKRQGEKVCFSPVTTEVAHAINLLARRKQSSIELEKVS